MYPTSDQKIIPYLFFDNLELAIPWLCRTFGDRADLDLDLEGHEVTHLSVEDMQCSHSIAS